MKFVFDIDGTIANAGSRLAHITNPEEQKNWDKFFDYDEIQKDVPIPATWELMRGILSNSKNSVWFITGRPQRTRQATLDWMCAKGCEHRFLTPEHFEDGRCDLSMRLDNDRRPSHESKLEILNFGRNVMKYDPVMAFEDRAQDVKMWREAGLICAAVDNGEF